VKVHDVVQGTKEWMALRAGIPTASRFDEIITPGRAASKSAERYMNELLAERVMGHPTISAVSTWMDRGSQMETEAVLYYEGQRDLDTVKVGFVSNDEMTIGASPDRFVGGDGLLEIKVPKEHTHMHYLLTSSVDAAYRPQVQGQLWVTGRQWADILSYHPEMPPALIRVTRDEAFIDLLSRAVVTFSEILEARTIELRERGWIK
jgi:hypothetical protein